MSTPSDPKHSTQPAKRDAADQQPDNKAEPGHSEQSKKDDRELPGADGPSSAGANEDTYD